VCAPRHRLRDEVSDLLVGLPRCARARSKAGGAASANTVAVISIVIGTNCCAVLPAACAH
jgi:hypothetical protein